MFLDLDEKLSAEILKMAREFGADLAGFVDIESLKRSPSHNMYSKLPIYALTESPDAGTTPEENQTTQDGIIGPQGAKTILIIAIRHPEDTPTLDYWRNPFAGGTQGNLQLIRIINKIIKLNKNRDEADFVPIEGQAEPMRVVAYCRACEFACPVGG
jgi:hypothetical protein